MFTKFLAALGSLLDAAVEWCREGHWMEGFEMRGSDADDLAAALVAGGVLPEQLEAGRHSFRPRRLTEVIYLVGVYCMVSFTLNGFDVPEHGEAA